MKLNLNAGLAKQIAKQLGLNPKTIARDELGAEVRQRMEAQAVKIARQMQRQGWTVAAKGESAVIRDALFRLWKVIVRNGHLADLVRDSHDDHVIAALAEPVSETTPLVEIVRLAITATVELAF
ncbi:MAG: hypothetical protein ACO1SX_06650 [Actinomycetota bacterium]